MDSILSELVLNFKIELDDTNEVPYGNGHINETYVVGRAKRYIIQKINTNVFRDPEAVMRNIMLVTEHIRRAVACEGGNPDTATLTVVPAADGKPYYRASNGDYYRAYLFIEDAVCYDQVECASQLYHAARTFGRFGKHLADFPAEELTEVLPDFHNTRARFRQLREAIAADKFFSIFLYVKQSY